MNWTAVRLILARELRDAVRDRRTLFTVVVLPVLLYPLLAAAFLPVAQLVQQQPSRVWVRGSDGLPATPKLFEGNRFAAAFSSPQQTDLLEVEFERSSAGSAGSRLELIQREQIQRELLNGHYDAVVCFPRRLVPQQLAADQSDYAIPALAGGTEIKVFCNASRGKSLAAKEHIVAVLHRWRGALAAQTLASYNVPAAALQPFEIIDSDVAVRSPTKAAIWSSVLPLVVLIWALTGALHAAVDLCPGERERGTLETLLSSPASRRDIVWAKLLTVVVVSMTSSLINMISMVITGLLVVGRLAHVAVPGISLTPPSIDAIGWMLLILIPVCVLFSGISLAVASLARSSKEGQYYMLPILLVLLPLMLFSMLPSLQLSLGTSLVPISGTMLLLRELIDGQYTRALTYCLPVFGVNVACCLVAVRWAVGQFNEESVLFRESEQLSVTAWLRNLARTRDQTPTFGQAILCGVLLLVLRLVAGLLVNSPRSWSEMVTAALLGQVALIAVPVVLMTVVLTRNPRQTLLLNWPRPSCLLAAIALAVTLHPLSILLQQAIQQLYPLGTETRSFLEAVRQLIAQSPNLWTVVYLLALTPAICEELAFRGFILSGLLRKGRVWTAILVSSLFFGAIHLMLQQSIMAAIVGLALGLVAASSRSLLPAVAFHLVFNTLGLLLPQASPQLLEQFPLLQHVLYAVDGGCLYRWPTTVLGTIVAAGIAAWFWRLLVLRSSGSLNRLP